MLCWCAEYGFALCYQESFIVTFKKSTKSIDESHSGVPSASPVHWIKVT